MDCIFIVDEQQAEKATEILDESFNDWFNSDASETYGDWLEEALNKEGIEFDSYYKGGY